MAQPNPTVDELEAREEQLFRTGPLSVLTSSVKSNTQILVNLRNNHKLLGRVKAFDRHCNLLLEGVREFYSEAPRDAETGKKVRGAHVMRDRYLPKLFVRGDSVILVVRNPK